MKKRILITGSSGMLGIDLCQELWNSYEIYRADLVTKLPSYQVTRFYKLDITDRVRVEALIKKIKPDVVIHTAAYTDVDGCEIEPKKAYKINAEGAKNVAESCKKIDAALIYISTDFVFDGRKKRPYKETDEANPISVYGDSKLKGEEAVKKILKKYFILRTSWLYGKHGKNFVDTILKISKKEKCLKVVDDQVGSPTYTKDMAKAMHVFIGKIANRRAAGLASSRAHFSVPYGIYHVSNSGAVSWCNYAKEILRLAKSDAGVVPISSVELNRPAKRPAMSVLDNSKFIKFTGYKMRNWLEALKEYVR